MLRVRRRSFMVASSLSGFLALGASVALADDRAINDRTPADAIETNIHIDGRYHSVINGIGDYDGFDRFRDMRGNPLPGWEWQLRSPG